MFVLHAKLCAFSQFKKMISVVLCGGSGARLWPLSRAHFPKQFLSLFSGETLLESCIERSLNCSHQYFVANEEHRFFGCRA